MGCGGTKQASEPTHTAPVKAAAPPESAPVTAPKPADPKPVQPTAPTAPTPSAPNVVEKPVEKPKTPPPKATPVAAAPPTVAPASTAPLANKASPQTLAASIQNNFPAVALLRASSTKETPAMDLLIGLMAKKNEAKTTIGMLHEISMEDTSKPWQGINLLNQIISGRT